MRTRMFSGTVGLLCAAVLWGAAGTPQAAGMFGAPGRGPAAVQVGPRPFYLVAGMQDSALKTELESCRGGMFRRTDFSIGHRGAPLQFPEHTRESYEAAARMGAGIVECDVTFTADGALVCRHAEWSRRRIRCWYAPPFHLLQPRTPAISPDCANPRP